MARIIGETYRVIVENPIGSINEMYPDIIYELNHGYIDGVMSADGEPQRAYVLGVSQKIKEFVGELIAIIHRLNDVENIWVISRKKFSKEEILEKVSFIEKYFKIEILM
jgi:inorganic pyrophosphatase